MGTPLPTTEKTATQRITVFLTQNGALHVNVTQRTVSTATGSTPLAFAKLPGSFCTSNISPSDTNVTRRWHPVPHQILILPSTLANCEEVLERAASLARSTKTAAGHLLRGSSGWYQRLLRKNKHVSLCAVQRRDLRNTINRATHVASIKHYIA